MKRYPAIPLCFVLILLAGCMVPVGTPVAPATEPVPATDAIAEETATLSPTAVSTPAPLRPMPAALSIQPTLTPYSNVDAESIESLPIGDPGHYVNLAFGYWMQYPESWYTQFGNRPLLASFSNLDPRQYSRAEMRDQGCLIEVNASVNLPGLSLVEIRSQMPRALANAEAFELDGAPALRIRRSSAEQGFESEWVYV